MTLTTPMTNKRMIRAVAGAAAVAGLMACGNGLTDVNRNPNNPTDASASSLFTNAVRTSVSRWLGTTYNWRGGEFLAQHLAEVQYTDEDTYLRLGRAYMTSTFDGAYYQELEDLRKVIGKGTAAGDAGIYGPAAVMKVWVSDFLTDSWGDIPYSQALAADSAGGSGKPAYDKQQAVYADFFKTLTDVGAALGTANATLDAADPIYGGDPASWQKFANSLHARLAMRLVNVDPALANTEPDQGVQRSWWSFHLQRRQRRAGVAGRWRQRQSVLGQPADARRLPYVADLHQRHRAPTIRVWRCSPRPPLPARTPATPNGVDAPTAQPYIRHASRVGTAFFPGATSYRQLRRARRHAGLPASYLCRSPVHQG